MKGGGGSGSSPRVGHRRRDRGRLRDGVSACQVCDFAGDGGDKFFIGGAFEDAADPMSDLLHIAFFHTAGGDGGGTDSDTGSDEGLLLIEGDGIFVYGDAGFIEGGGGVFSGDTDGGEVCAHEVVIGTAGDDTDILAFEGGGEGLGVGDDLAGVFPEGGLEGFGEADGLSGDDVHEGAALDTWEDLLIDGLCVGFFAKDEAAAGATEGFVGGGGDEIGEGDGGGVEAGSDEAGDVRHIDHEVGADVICDGTEAFKIDNTGIGGSACEDEAGVVEGGEACDLVVIDALGFLGDAVGDDIEEAAGEIEFMAMGEVAAIGEAHSQDGIAGLEHGEIDGHIGAGAGVGLDVSVFGAEELFSAFDGEGFGFIDELATVVVALGWEAFGVLIGHDGALGFPDGSGGVIFGGDEFEVEQLAVFFVTDGGIDIGVGGADCFWVSDTEAAGIDFTDAAAVAGGGVEIGCEPGFENTWDFLEGGKGGAEAEDIGVIVFAGHFSHSGVGDEGGADAWELIGGDTHSDTGGTDEDTGVEGSFCDTACDFDGEVRVIDGFWGVATEVDDFGVGAGGEEVLDVLFDFEAAVVGGQTDAKGHGGSFFC